MYSFFFRTVIRHLDAERAHHLAMTALRIVAHRLLLGRLIAAVLRPRDPRLRVHALGKTFAGPLGVAAGLDKDAAVYNQLATLGFGFVEIGTVTARAQPGNDRPRVHRLIRSRALLNSMGFPNQGAEAVAGRLRGRRDTLVGVNVGKSRDVGIDDADADYARTLTTLGPLADYVVLNVSSPNTAGLRALQEVERLGPLVDRTRGVLRERGSTAALLLKIAPDLTDEQVDAVADLALEHGLDGIIATNTTLSRAGIHGEPVPSDKGGISGAPLKARAVEVLERLHDRVGDDLVLLSAGGIETADDAWQRILAGATLLQAYTGFVFGGPLWVRRINRGLAARLEAAGARSFDDVRGTARRSVQR